MYCDLARTGTDLAWAPVIIIIIALAVILFGIVLALRGRRAVLMLAGLLVLLGALAVTPSPAHAACSSPLATANSLIVEQTSTNSGLAPWEAPSPIAGRVTNTGPDETFVTAVTASIASVVKAAGAAAGACDATDYVLLDSRMPVGQQLATEGGTALFSGAAIGFFDKPANQDACKGAVVLLHYVVD